jgi:hypothetical protein
MVDGKFEPRLSNQSKSGMINNKQEQKAEGTYIISTK